MALQKCSECDNEVSTKARTCPNCGAPVKKPAKRVSTGAGLLIVLLATVGIVFAATVLGSPESPTAWKSEDNSTSAYVVLERFVEKRLKSPSTANFPSVYERESHIRSLGNQTYRITSHVDSQNGFSATMRTAFIGEIQETSEDKWKLLSLEFVN